ncbi:hypothetical protein CLOP_g24049 [Closterium sp. NIES-67]|nr:hypothetical protein CLOP_g24049 [Closterium sp. NIES-67]
MVLEYQNPPGLKSGSRSGECIQAANDTMASLSAVPQSGTKSSTKTPNFRRVFIVGDGDDDVAVEASLSLHEVPRGTHVLTTATVQKPA